MSKKPELLVMITSHLSQTKMIKKKDRQKGSIVIKQTIKEEHQSLIANNPPQGKFLLEKQQQ